MNISRREFLILTAGVAMVVECPAMGDAVSSSAASQERMIDAGPVGNFAADGVYDAFRDLGFFVIRKGGKLFALSSICTHRKATLKAEPDCSFYCKRHGSIFDPGGHVIKGPAKRDLFTLETSVSETGRLLVKVPAF
jgi:Rieske Fe-S protein